MAGQGAVARKADPDACAVVGAAPGPSWRPSRFFDAWKKQVAATRGDLVLQYMHYYRGMPPDVKRRAVDFMLRGTMPDVYISEDRCEAFDAMDNDIGAMREYAAAFLDRFWKEYWAGFVAAHPPPDAPSCAPPGA